MTRYSRNERNRRTIERGRLPLHERLLAAVRSRIPVYRDRISPAHGNPHRMDEKLARTQNTSLAQAKAKRAGTDAWVRADHAERAGRQGPQQSRQHARRASRS